MARDGSLTVNPSIVARGYVAFTLAGPAMILIVIAVTTVQESLMPAVAVALVAIGFILRGAVRPRLLIDSEQVTIINAIRTWRIPMTEVDAIDWGYTLCLSKRLRHGPPAVVFLKAGRQVAPPAHATALLADEDRGRLVAALESVAQSRGIVCSIRAQDLINLGGN